jgi:hypothetical protein
LGVVVLGVVADTLAAVVPELLYTQLMKCYLRVRILLLLVTVVRVQVETRFRVKVMTVLLRKMVQLYMKPRAGELVEYTQAVLRVQNTSTGKMAVVVAVVVTIQVRV